MYVGQQRFPVTWRSPFLIPLINTNLLELQTQVENSLLFEYFLNGEIPFLDDARVGCKSGFLNESIECLRDPTPPTISHEHHS